MNEPEKVEDPNFVKTDAAGNKRVDREAIARKVDEIYAPPESRPPPHVDVYSPPDSELRRERVNFPPPTTPSPTQPPRHPDANEPSTQAHQREKGDR